MQDDEFPPPAEQLLAFGEYGPLDHVEMAEVLENWGPAWERVEKEQHRLGVPSAEVPCWRALEDDSGEVIPVLARNVHPDLVRFHHRLCHQGAVYHRHRANEQALVAEVAWLRRRVRVLEDARIIDDAETQFRASAEIAASGESDLRLGRLVDRWDCRSG